MSLNTVFTFQVYKEGISCASGVVRNVLDITTSKKTSLSALMEAFMIHFVIEIGKIGKLGRDVFLLAKNWVVNIKSAPIYLKKYRKK